MGAVVFESGMMNFRLPCFLLALVPLTCAAAPPLQDGAEIRRNVEGFLTQHIQTLPGTSTFSISKIEANSGRAACSRLQSGLAPNARAYGKTTVLVQCSEGQEGINWRVYVPVQIDVQTHYFASSRSLAQGQALTDSDLTQLNGNLADLPGNVVTDSAAAIGRVAAVPIAAGQALRADLLRQAWVIQAGQKVKVSIRGNGFEVTAEGRALAAAAEGKPVQVRLANGQLISGTAQAGGWVEVRN